MRRAKGVIFALAALGKTGKPTAGSNRANPVPPAGEDLMRIALMANIPDQPVFGCVEHIMDRRRQLNHAQPRAQMPAGYRNRANHLAAQFIGKLAQIANVQFAKVGGNLYLVQQGCRRFLAHSR